MTTQLDDSPGTSSTPDTKVGAIPSFDVTLKIRRYTPETHGDEPY